MINQKIHNYKIISLLGEGGMATVYLAEHVLLRQLVAIKLLKSDFVQHPNIRKRFLAEARSMAHMNHPHVIKVTDLIDSDETVAFVMEYIEGETLEHVLVTRGKLTTNEIQTYLTQMIDAVEYIHAQGFIHRDIKPSNFLIGKNGVVKLLDFGIAKNVNDATVDYTKTSVAQQMGSPLYMSPEQVLNTAEVTKFTDIYSLGVVLWQMVMNKNPYDATLYSLPEIQVAIIKEPIPKTHTIWDTIIQKATDKTPEKRTILAVLDRANDLEATMIDIQPKENIVSNKAATRNRLKRRLIAGFSFLSVFTIILLSYWYSKSNLDTAKNVFLAKKEILKLAKDSVNSDSIIIYSPKIENNNTNQKSEENQKSNELKKQESNKIENDVVNESIDLKVDNPDQVKLGYQIWSSVNLNVDRFRNGDFILQVKTDDEWKKAGEMRQPAWCYYNNDPLNGAKYGKLYNWYAVNDPRGLAPHGWHIPSKSEWTTLNFFLGSNAGRKMKSTSGWDKNGNGSNESGFSGLPGGYRNYYGYYNNVFMFANWWCSSEFNSKQAWGVSLVYGLEYVSYNENFKDYGLSVRCIKD